MFALHDSDVAFGYTNNMVVHRSLFERCGPFWEVPRGADSVFVFRVMEDYSPTVVTYVAEARVYHLELTALTTWMRKKVIYGKVAQRMFSQGIRRHRDLTSLESREVLRRTLRRNGYTRLQTWRLIAVVIMGMCSYRLGRLTARWPA